MTPHAALWAKARRVACRLGALSLAVTGVLAGVTIIPAAVPAQAASNTPATGSQVFGPGCGNYPPSWGGFEATGTTPNWVSSGDYSGHVSYGVSSSPTCAYITGYVLDKTGSPTTTFQWFYGATGSGQSPDLQGQVCSVWAYIPTVDAGDRDARYDVWGGHTGQAASNWLFWPGHTIDQENTSGWIYLGSHTMGGNNWIQVTLNNTDNSNPGWYTGAGAMAFSCIPPSAPPPVPGSVTATATNPNTIHVSWTDNAGGNAQDIVTDGPTNTAALPYGSTSWNWIGLVPGTYRCSAVEAGNPAGWSAWSPWACATTPVPVATNVTAVATSPTSIKLTWTDNTGGYSQYLVTDGSGDYSPTLPAGTTSYTWTTGLASNTYKCLTVLAEGPNANSGWSQYACVTTPWSETDARNDLISKLAATPTAWRDRITATIPGQPSQTETMDTAKILQTSPGNYIAVYTAGSAGNEIHLATSTDLMNWTFVTRLDTSATQPWIAAGPNGSFMVADEKFDTPGATQGPSHLYFLHYLSLGSLTAAQPDWYTEPSNQVFGTRFYSNCNEGTPNIKAIQQNGQNFTVSFGFHYNSLCGTPGPDREAYGTFQTTAINSSTGQATATWTPSRDTTRDQRVESIGYTGSLGGRDDITWHGWPFSIQEAQCGLVITSDCTIGNTNYWVTSFRFVLYDYTNQQAFPVTIPPVVESVNGTPAPCHGNPKITALNDPTGTAVLVVTGYIFGPTGGCVPSGTIAGPFEYVVPAG